MISEALSWGCLAGVTTNPSLYAKIGGASRLESHMVKIAQLCEDSLHLLSQQQQQLRA